jgi:hypothetical protein
VPLKLAFAACVAHPMRINALTRFGFINELFPDGLGVPAG